MLSDELRRQVEAAYDYRGHVTLRLRDGSAVEGFVYNREFENPRAAETFYLDVCLKDQDARKRFPLDSISSIELTGEDCAAGKSYADHSAKKTAEPK